MSSSPLVDENEFSAVQSRAIETLRLLHRDGHERITAEDLTNVMKGPICLAQEKQHLRDNRLFGWFVTRLWSRECR